MKTKTILILAIAMLMIAACVWTVRKNPTRPEHGTDSNATKISRTNEVPVLKANEVNTLIEEAAAGLQRNPEAASRTRLLDHLRARLAALPKADAVALIRKALAAGLDAPTGLDLKPGGDGKLAAASSLRVFLLDQLLALDAPAARDFAKKILEFFTTTDEWAVSLAACATDTSAAGRDFAQRKAREMVLHEPWQQQPSAGFLEAFDVFVFTHDTAFAPELAGFLGQTTNRALAHAAFLTLDRLVLSDTAATLDALSARPELLQTRESTRAGYFARADVRDAEQRAVLEHYLLNPALTPAELDRFAGTFPNANYMVSQNLLTPSSTPDAATLAARDAASLLILDQWLADPRFAHRKPALTSIRSRLQSFVSPPAK